MIHSETKRKYFRKQKTGRKGMKRKVLSVMLCAAMVVSMTACGGSDAKENTASANASVSETEQGEATEQDAQEEEPITCTLTVWSPSEDQDPEYGQWLNTMCDQFNELPPNWDIHLTMVFAQNLMQRN